MTTPDLSPKGLRELADMVDGMSPVCPCDEVTATLRALATKLEAPVGGKAEAKAKAIVEDWLWFCNPETPPQEQTELLQSLTATALANAERENERLRKALKDAVRVAGEARAQWDANPEGMKAGKLLVALSGHCPGYRADIDAIHAAIKDQSHD